jgi:ABC-type amino acid transport substrate-binding protein
MNCMIKWLSQLRFIFLSLLVVGLVSCGEDGLFGPNTPTPNLIVSTPTTVSLPPDASTPARIRAQGYVRVGVRYDDDPFGNVDGQGDLVGFDVDLAREFALRWLGDPQAVRFVQVTNASVSEKVRTGQVDLVIGALPRHQTTALDMDFSAAYYYDGLSLMVHSGPAITNTVIIAGPGDLDGVSVGVVEDDDTEAPLLRAAGQALPQVVYYPDYFSAVAGLEARVVDAVVGPRRTLGRLAAGSSSLGLTPTFTRNSFAIGVPKNEGPFLDLVNVTLMNVINDGTYGRLFGQWFPDEAPPGLEIWTGTSRLSFAEMSDTLAPAPATIQQIEARGYLAVGILDNQLPFGDFDANGVVRGFEADLARILVGRWLGDVAAVQFVRHTEESGIAALQSGQIDLLAARLPHTLPRDDEIDFTQTIYQGGIGFLVAAESGVSAIGGLNGGTVAVPNDGITGDVIQRAAARAGIAVSVQAASDASAALAGVAEGRYRAYGGWRSELLILAYTNSGFLVLDERLTDRPIALGLRQNDGAFRDLVNLTLQAVAADGRFAAAYAGWFGTDPPFAVEVWPGAPFRSLKLNPATVVVPTVVP